MFTRIKNWWKGCTTAQKVNAVLDIIGIGLTGYGIHKVNHAFDSMRITVTQRADEELNKHLHPTYVRIETPDLHAEGVLTTDEGSARPVSPEELAPNEEL